MQIKKTHKPETGTFCTFHAECIYYGSSRFQETAWLLVILKHDDNLTFVCIFTSKIFQIRTVYAVQKFDSFADRFN
mgnify:CR=1 FL=1